jgi:hypothetical protein
MSSLATSQPLLLGEAVKSAVSGKIPMLLFSPSGAAVSPAAGA